MSRLLEEEKHTSTSWPKRGKAKAAPSTITQLEEELEGLTTYGGGGGSGRLSE
jgi:hypothetical protein